MVAPLTSQSGSAIHTLLRLLAACCVVVVGVIAAQLIMQRFELGSAEPGAPDVATPATPAAEPAPPIAAGSEAVEMDLSPALAEPAADHSDSIPYQVQATFISDPPTFSRALLRGPNGQSKWYLTGEEPKSGLVLKEVQKDRVVFTWRGDDRVQLLKRDAEAANPARPARSTEAPLPQPYAPPPPPPPPGPAKAEAESPPSSR